MGQNMLFLELRLRFNVVKLKEGQCADNVVVPIQGVNGSLIAISFLATSTGITVRVMFF